LISKINVERKYICLNVHFLNSNLDQQPDPLHSSATFSPARWCLNLIVVRRFEYASDPESYTSSRVATGRASLAGQVKG